jgi:uncharacterized protein (TIGR03083 family)
MLLGRPSPGIDAGQPEHVRNDIGSFNEVWVVSLAPVPRQEVLAQFGEVTDARRKALASMGEENFSEPSWTPVGQADYRRFMQIRVFDCWVHEQDVRSAVGRPGHASGPVAEQAVDEIARALGYIVGKRAAAPQGSSVTFELTGPLTESLHVVVDGRARLVDSLDAPAGVTVTMGSDLFTRLASGRVEPGVALSEVQLSGDMELGRRIIDNLAFTI